jgi:hypothetical protein
VAGNQVFVAGMTCRTGADEIRVTKQGGIVWMALAMMVKTRWCGDHG